MKYFLMQFVLNKIVFNNNKGMDYTTHIGRVKNISKLEEG
jgi:hypothetical protein